MKSTLTGRSFLKIVDFTPAEIEEMLSVAHLLKKKKKDGEAHCYLGGKNICLLFEKTSTRTRCAFEVAAHDLGMNVTYLDPASSQMGNKESIEDTAKVLGRFYDGIEYRGFLQETVECLARESGVPVWNGLTDDAHPTQMIADMMTIQEKLGFNLKGRKLVYVGDSRNNVASSLAAVCVKLGMHFVACAPCELWPSDSLVQECKETCATTGGSISLSESIDDACANADVIYTDIWVSMGEPSDIWGSRINLLRPYQVNNRVMKRAGDNCIFMHCLPSFHDLNTTVAQDVYRQFGISEMEVTDEVFRSNQSVVFDQAENRMHSIKAIMLCTLASKWE